MIGTLQEDCVESTTSDHPIHLPAHLSNILGIPIPDREETDGVLATMHVLFNVQPLNF